MSPHVEALRGLRAGLAPLPAHPSDRRQPQPGKITRKGGRRPSRVTRSALAGDLARLHTGAPGGGPPLQLARLAPIVAVLGRGGGLPWLTRAPPPPSPRVPQSA